MALVSVRRLLVALAVCLIGTNEYGLVEGEMFAPVKCKAKCTKEYSMAGQPSMAGDEEDACTIGCDKMWDKNGIVTDKDSCVSECSDVRTTRIPRSE